MKECIGTYIAGLFTGILIMYIVGICIINGVYRRPMEYLGIERFQRCEINTTNCYSNWYEIVYKDKR